MIGQIPKSTLQDIVFGDKSSELSEDTFKAVLKASLRIGERFGGGEQYVDLHTDQIERLVRNPYIISHEEFEEIKNNGDDIIIVS